MIGETFASLLTVSVQPLVAGFPTDAITLAQLRKAHRFFLRQSHKLLAQRHETTPHGISSPPFRFQGELCLWLLKKCYPCLRYTCYLCLQSIHSCPMGWTTMTSIGARLVT